MLTDDGVPLEVKTVEPTGSEVMVHGHIGSEPLFCLFRERLDTSPGAILKLKIDPENVHLFDAATGVAI
jgi:multiple sugar transport system ATP-binding protein